MRAAAIALAAGALASACGGGDGGVAAQSQGTLTVGITDAPVDSADAIYIQVRGLAFKREGAAPERIQNLASGPLSLDLLEYQEGRVAVLLDSVPFEAGRYEWLRLIVDAEPNVRDSYAVVNGQECELRVPSGAESGLKMIRGFTLPENGSLALTIDFDLRQSVHAPPGLRSGVGACTQGYLLRPTLRLLDDANVGAVAGTVSFESGAVPAGCLPKVYLYSGTVAPDDIEATTGANPDVDPVTVAGVRIPEGASSGTYRAAFLPAGAYTAAFTCSDDTEEDETLQFVPEEGSAVTVQNNLISTVNFTVPAPPAD